MNDDRPNDGFTLIELLVSTMIVGIVLGAVFGSLALYFNTVTDTTDRLTESPSLQIVSSWFGTDAASSSGFTAACGAPAGPLVSFSWTDPGGDTITTDDRAMSVSYVVESSPGNVHQKVLNRYSCIGGTAQSTITVMSYLSPRTADTPKLWCDGLAAATCTTATKTVAITFAMCTAKTTAAECMRTSVPAEVQGHRRMT